ncbi:MAG: RIP metalloprotease RseP [Desulfobulbaceae bacterium]|nr:RIP metalloprotease RseP [Desulfobulbaceae bacterium]
MTSLLSFVIVLGILIFVHEFGHFLFAKLFGVKVTKFSLGFGPKLVGFQRGETEYLVSALPLGGYVKMVGEQAEEEISSEDESRSFAKKPVWQRAIIVAAGPLFNLLFAVLIFFLIFAINGLPKPVDNSVIGAVTAGSPAERAGLKTGDIIVAINGQKTATWEEVAELISTSKGEPVILEIRRGSEQLTITGAPEISPSRNIFGEETGKRYMLGIARSEEVTYERVSLGVALQGGFTQTWGFIYLTLMGIVKMIQAVIPASELGGPILIAQLAGKQLHQGWMNLVYFMGLISVNLGILNLLPIPVLDGGHLMFFSYEALRRKPPSQRAMEICQQVGIVLLASLMVFVFYNDIARLFHQG